MDALQIYLLDNNKEITDSWNKYFKAGNMSKRTNIEIVNDTFKNFMDTHNKIEAVVSPANSFGMMDGGYDWFITQYFGEKLMRAVQEKLLKVWHGEQPVGTSLSVEIPDVVIQKYADQYKNMILIHTPTMRTPEITADTRIIYQCMRTTLIQAIDNNINSVVIPAFCGGVGKVHPDEVARMMYLGYKQIFSQPMAFNWIDINKNKNMINKGE